MKKMVIIILSILFLTACMTPPQSREEYVDAASKELGWLKMRKGQDQIMTSFIYNNLTNILSEDYIGQFDLFTNNCHKFVWSIFNRGGIY